MEPLQIQQIYLAMSVNPLAAIDDSGESIALYEQF
jgi:hypothetical protein